MSWQSYVDGQLLSTNMVKHAVICGHDGNIWAASPDFKVSYTGSVKPKYGTTFLPGRLLFRGNLSGLFGMARARPALPRPTWQGQMSSFSVLALF